MSKDKSLDATPSPDAPRTLHIHIGSSQENVTADGESDRGEGGGGKESGSAPTKESPFIEKRRVQGSPLVRMKHVHSRESMGEGGRTEEAGEEERAHLKKIREMYDVEDRAGKRALEHGETDSNIIRLTPPPRSQTGNGEDLNVSANLESREERGGEEEEEGEVEEEREGEGEEGITEDDETEDEEGEEGEGEEEGGEGEEDEEGEGEEEGEEDDSVSPSKETSRYVKTVHV